MVIVGIPGALTLAGAMTLFQRNTEDSHRGRAFGALGAVEAVAVLAGTAGAGFLGQSLGIIPVLAFQGASYVVAGLPTVGTLATATALRRAWGQLATPHARPPPPA